MNSTICRCDQSPGSTATTRIARRVHLLRQRSELQDLFGAVHMDIREHQTRLEIARMSLRWDRGSSFRRNRVVFKSVGTRPLFLRRNCAPMRTGLYQSSNHPAGTLTQNVSAVDLATTCAKNVRLSTGRVRLVVLDVVRGIAIAGVVLYHLIWDLDFTSLLSSGISWHPAWIWFARTLAGTFMFLVGVNLVLAHAQVFRLAAFAKRLAVIAFSAATISIVTAFAFPESFIFFGILHAIAVASIIGVFFVRVPALLVLVAGASVVLLSFLIEDELFNTRWLAWIGFAEQPPTSNDLVPVFPWAGLTLLGIALTKIGLRQSVDKLLERHEPSGAMARFTAWLGRYSLAIYLIHQPVLLAVIIPTATWLSH